MEIKKACQYCGGNVAFPVEMKGQKTNCPHCNREIILTISTVQMLRHRLAEMRRNPPSPRKVKGIAALMLLAAAILTPVGVVFLMNGSSSNSDYNMGVFMAGLGFPLLLGGMVLFTLARARE